MSYIFWQTKITGITDNKTVGLPSPDGSQDGKWYFPNSVVTRIVTPGINGFWILQPGWNFQPIASTLNFQSLDFSTINFSISDISTADIFPPGFKKFQRLGLGSKWASLLIYRKVVSSWPVYYSILDSLGQRSQYISIKFPLHKQFGKNWMCY